MRRIVILLGAALGWVALHHLARSRQPPHPARAGNPYPFPTRTSHEAIDLFDERDMGRWAIELGCDEDRLRGAIDQVGTSIERLREHLATSNATPASTSGAVVEERVG